MPLQLSFGEASGAGPREENQDAIRVVTPAPLLAASKGYLFAIADGVSQCADGGLAARATLQALARKLGYSGQLREQQQVLPGSPR